MSYRAQVHWIFWVIAVLGLLWHIGTVMNFLSQIAPGGTDNLPPEYRAIVENRPVWATIAFAVAGIAGLIGCALLLLRRAVAIPFLWMSAAGVVVQMIPAIGAADEMSLWSVILVFAMTLLVIGILIWTARRAAARSQII